MTSKVKYVVLYVIALLQGISFTLIPGASSYLISSQGFALSTSQYSQLFLPMIVFAILSSFFGGKLSRKWGIRNISLLSGAANCFSMAIFFTSYYYLNFGYEFLIFCLLFLGLGFGANIATLNSYVFDFFPKYPSSSLTTLHATLGLGTAIGPVLFQYCLLNDVWYMAPLSLSVGYLVLLILTRYFFPENLDLPVSQTTSLCSKVWVFIAIAFLYGICETTFGNWGILFLKEVRNVSSADAAVCLSAFWGAVTLGRIAIAFLSRNVSLYAIYVGICLILLGSLLFINFTSYDLLSFAIAGFGCSAFLPFTVSLGQSQDLSQAERISGILIAVYLMGYAFSAYGFELGFQYLHFSLSSLYIDLAVFVLALFFLVIRSRKYCKS